MRRRTPGRDHFEVWEPRVRYFPIFMDLEGRRVVVVGGGEQALQKVRLLLKTPATIAVVTEAFHADLTGERIELIQRRFSPADLDGAAIAFVATGDARLAA